MSKMTRPEMKVVRFKEADVIVASNAKMAWSKFSDGDVSNNRIRFGDGSSFVFNDSTAEEVLQVIYDKTGAHSGAKIWNEKADETGEGNLYPSLTTVTENIIKGGDNSAGKWNQAYVYNSELNRFDKQ